LNRAIYEDALLRHDELMAGTDGSAKSYQRGHAGYDNRAAYIESLSDAEWEMFLIRRATSQELSTPTRRMLMPLLGIMGQDPTAEETRKRIHLAVERADRAVLRVVATQLGIMPRPPSEDAGKPMAPVDRIDI
jgi:hypothetical protein